MKKKSQMELMGLALIIVLLTFGLLIVMKFMLNKKPNDDRQSFVHSELASSFLSTLLKTSSGCRKATFTELFQSCANGETFECFDGTSNVPVCKYLHTKTNEIMRSTFKDSEDNYIYDCRFTATKDGSSIFRDATGIEFSPALQYPQGKFCEQFKSRVFPIPLHPGTLLIELDICD